MKYQITVEFTRSDGHTWVETYESEGQTPGKARGAIVRALRNMFPRLSVRVLVTTAA